MTEDRLRPAGARIVETVDLAPTDRAALLNRAYDEILRPSFPDNELIERDELIGACNRSPEARPVAVAVGPGDEILGCIVGQWYPASRTLLVAYLAIAAARRGSGVGSGLVQAMVQSWAGRLDALLVVAEVEDPAVHPASDGQDPAGRLRLYGRLGAMRLPFAYVQPEVRAGAGRVGDMFLIVTTGPSRGVVPTADGPVVPAAVVRDFLVEYYADVEGSRYDDEPFRAMLAGLGAGPLIPLLALPT
jgi:hypothetical protein